MGEKKLTRREVVKAGTMAVAGAAVLQAGPFLTGFGNRAFAAMRKIRIGVIAPSHCALSMVHAHLSGIYKRNGLETEILYFKDMPEIAKGLLSGDLQVGQLITPVFYAINTGIGPFKGAATPLVTAQFAGTNGGVLIVSKDSGIIKPTDLAGKKIGVHSPLMVHSLLINEMLRRNRLDPAKDLSISTIRMDDLIPALQRGEIDAFINPEPLGTFAESKGVGRLMMMTEKLWTKHPCCLVAMKSEFYKKESELAKQLYKSSMESALLINNPKTRGEAISLIHKDSPVYNGFPAKDIQQAFQPGRSDFDPFVYQSSGRAVLKMMADSKLLPPSVQVEQMVAETFLSDASRELLTALGEQPPATNDRPEKVIGKYLA